MKTKRLLGGMAALAFFAARDAISQPAPLEINQQPNSTWTSTGSGVRIVVWITGTGQYRWQFNGRDLLGASGQIPGNCPCIELNLPNVQTINAGDYQLFASNSLGSVTSRVARLTVYTNIPPVWVF